MHRRVIASLFGLLPLLTGCSVIRQMNSNLIFEKRLFHSVEKQEERIEDDSEELLKLLAGKHPHKVFTKDFRLGFKDGYRDFLIYGGPVRPPATPPGRYRTAKYLTPEGHCQVRDYFLGFQYGSECAQSTGRRQFFTIPILTTDPTPPPPLDIEVLPAPPDGLSGEKPKTETVPVPMTNPMTTPKAMTPPVEAPKKETPKAEPPKVEPKAEPKPETPKVEPPKVMAPAAPTPMVKPEPKYDPLPKLDPPANPTPTPRPMTEAIPIPAPPSTVPVLPAVNVPLVPPAPPPPTYSALPPSNR